MTLAHSFSSPSPAPRWLLLASLAVNLFLVGLIAALLWREPGPVDRSVSARVEEIASALPRADGDKLRAEFSANRAGVEGTRAKYEEGREAIRQALRREPFDGAALRDAMTRTRTARQDFDAALQSVIAKAAADMSACGRAAMADWRPPPPRSNR